MNKLFYIKTIHKECLDLCTYGKYLRVGNNGCHSCMYFKNRNTDENWIECKLHTIHIRKDKLKRILNENR